MSENRFALLIGCSVYDDQKLTPLPSATKDIEELGRVLATFGVGDFTVSTLPDRPAHEAALAIQDFLAERQPNDLVLVQLSCHGLKDADGKLYFAARNTKTDRLLATAIPAATVNDLLTACRCRRKLLLFDCCYGGAFIRGIVPRSGRRVGVFDRFPEGRGLVVITSSDALQYAYEGELVNGTATSSVFTGLVVKGIETGAADKNGDGLIGVTELYQYVSERMSNERPEQRPEINNFRLQGEIYVARSRNISLQLPLTWIDAHAGGEKVVEVNGKPTTVAIPAGVKDGQQERYIGKGLPTEDGIPPGDLVITFNVAPRRPADAARARLKAILSGVVATLMLAVLFFLLLPLNSCGSRMKSAITGLLARVDP